MRVVKSNILGYCPLSTISNNNRSLENKEKQKKQNITKEQHTALNSNIDLSNCQCQYQGVQGGRGGHTRSTQLNNLQISFFRWWICVNATFKQMGKVLRLVVTWRRRSCERL